MFDVVVVGGEGLAIQRRTRVRSVARRIVAGVPASRPRRRLRRGHLRIGPGDASPGELVIH